NAAKVAVQKYRNPNSADPMTDYENDIINAALNIVLPARSDKNIHTIYKHTLSYTLIFAKS
ncbi:MAG: hypothetical protein IJ950_04520, partial [Helicobacter sp.]|nr:hypothetical protein [Helicobacter sp.]